MKTLLLILIPCVAFAGTEPINVNTTDGHVKATSSGVGPSPKPFNFSDVHTAGILLKEHGDVNITSPTDAQVLTYDSGTSKWKNEDVGGGGIGTLKDVTVEDNSGFSGGGIPSMSNVVTLTPDNNLFELYDGGSDQAVLKLKTVTGSALTKTDDTNITLTLGGSASTSLVNAASLTLGWTGTLSQARGGFGKSTASTTDGQIPIGKTSDGTWNVNTITAGTGISVTNGAGVITIANTGAVSTGNLTDVGTDGLVVTGGTGAVVGSGTSLAQHVSDASHNGYLSSADWTTFNGHSTVTPAALTKTDDTNVTLTLAGTPATSLLQATSITAGWTGTLAAGRGGTGVSSLGNLTKSDDTNVTLTLGGTPTGALITSASIAAGWTGTLSQARGGFGKSTASTTDGQIPIGKTSDGSWNVNTITAGTGISVTNGAGAITITNNGVTSSEVSDTAFASSWNGVTTTAPSKNAVYDEIHLFDTSDDGTIINAGTGFRIGGAAASGKILVGNGTNYVASTPTFPNSSATTRKIIVSDGTNWTASTETYAVPGTSGNLLTSNGTNWTSAAAAAQTHAVTFVVDGSGAVLTTGTKSYTKIPYGGTLTGWLLIGSPSGSVTIDIFRAADGAGLPVTSIIGGSGTKPALSSAVENSSTSFTSWTSTTLTAKDNMAISLSGITTTTYCALTLYYQ